MNRLSIIILCTMLNISIHAQDAVRWGEWLSWGEQTDGTYRNPVIPADYSDLDCIRVGRDYYAISSTMQFSPGMTILHSRDLVNWEIAGNASATSRRFRLHSAGSRKRFGLLAPDRPRKTYAHRSKRTLLRASHGGTCIHT